MPGVVVRGGTPEARTRHVLALGALAVPALGALVIPSPFSDYEALLWLLATMPVLVLGRDRGWEGVGIALGATAFTLGVSYVTAAALGDGIPALLPGVGAALVCVSIGIGWVAEGRPGSSAEADPDADLIDTLTALPTRAQAELFLEKEFAAARLGRPLVLVMFDLDEFSSFNARFGEAAGNGVLKAFATLLRQNTRRMNLSARWGPEEFVAILCGSSHEGALIFAERILDLLRAASETTAVPTVSAGVAFYRPNVSCPAELVAAANEALLRAKQDGRDRIRIHGTTLTPETERNATAPVASEQVEMPAAEPERSGVGRSAFVFTADGLVRTLVSRQLAADGFRVREGMWPGDGVLALQQDHDLVLADVGGSGSWSDLVDEIRRRSPATRIIGIPRVQEASVSASVLAVRVDGYCVLDGERVVFHPALQEQLRERDRLVESAVRERQLSGEVRAKEREGRIALQESEARYASVVQRIKEVIFETDAEGRLTFVNPAWSAITGHAVESSLGQPLIGFVHPEDREAARTDHAELVEALRPYVRRELRLGTASGGIRWVEVRAQATRSPTSVILGVSGLMTDVHDRKEAAEALRRSEEYFRSLIENSADVMAVLDPDAHIRYASPAVERVLGYRPEERVGCDVTTILHPEDADAARREISGLGEPGAAEYAEVRVLHKDGFWRWLEVCVRNLMHVRSVEGIVVNARDVTDRKSAERALRESEELLYRTQKMDAIGRLAGGVAHDFNNLLTSIQGSAEAILASLSIENPLRGEILGIRDTAGRATTVTRQLLAFSRKQELKPRVINLAEVINPMRKMLQRLLGKDVELTVEIDGDAAPTNVDPQQIEQVILNLAINARDAMPAGGRLALRVSSQHLSAPTASHGEDIPAGTYVVLSVTDCGAGIPPELIDQVFDPFFTSRPGTGAPGLGLSTVYGIVKQSEGFIRVESRTAGEEYSREPTGTRFEIYLPVSPAHEARVPQTEAEEPIQVGGETIALVEDEKAVRELAQRVLRNKGYSVIAAENGKHAIDVIGRFPDRIDLLVTDVVMPEMNGRDLADRISVMRPGVKILFMSGYTEEAILHHGVLADGTAFLPKPFSPDGLATAVREVLDTPDRVRKRRRAPLPPDLRA